MSDAIETTGAGATRVLFGTIAFICLMVGIEGVTGAENISISLSVLLIIIGALCAYAAFFWNKAKKAMSDNAKNAIIKFSQHTTTKSVLLFAILFAITLSPFVEQRRWPFSYPVDPAIMEDNKFLNNRMKEVAAQANTVAADAAKWNFSYILRYAPRAKNNSLLTCRFSLVLSSGQNARNFWATLQPMLELAHWENVSESDESRPETPFGGVAILSGRNEEARRCGIAFAKALGGAFPQSNIVLRTEQTSANLVACKEQCIEIDIGN